MLGVMDKLRQFFSKNSKQCIAVGVGLASVVILYRRYKKNKKRVCGVDYPKDTVIVHQSGKGRHAPSLGHFVVKLETYLRIAKIPYQPDYRETKAPKNKIPWIEYNGVSMGDSQLIINFLNKEFNVDLNKGLTPRDRAVAWGIQKWLEEFTYWLNVYIRWYLELDDEMDLLFPKGFKFWLLKQIVRRKIKKATDVVGVGRHSREEVQDMMMFDMRQISLILGDKKFLMGNEPTELDCAAFGQLAQIRWHTPDSCPGKRLLKAELTNLMAYTDRIKDLYWPDWNDRITAKSSQ